MRTRSVIEEELDSLRVKIFKLEEVLGNPRTCASVRITVRETLASDCRREKELIVELNAHEPELAAHT
jgi:hypothetical protein